MQKAQQEYKLLTPAKYPDRQAEKTLPNVRQAPGNSKEKTQLAAWAHTTLHAAISPSRHTHAGQPS